jgi:hypothetical protein
VHIEIDVMEMIVLIFFYCFFKWLFRGIIVIFFIKLIDLVKRKGEAKIGEIKSKFTPKDDNERDLEN